MKADFQKLALLRIAFVSLSTWHMHLSYSTHLYHLFTGDSDDRQHTRNITRKVPRGRTTDRPSSSPGVESPVLRGNKDGVWNAFSRRFSSGRKIPPNLTRLEETWRLAKSSAKRYGPWQAGPWYPDSHCADNLVL